MTTPDHDTTQQSAPPSPAEIGGLLYGSWAALSGTWVHLANQRLKENLKLPRELAACSSLQDLLRVYSNHGQSALRQYQSRLSELQVIALQLMGQIAIRGCREVEAIGGIQARRRFSQAAKDNALP
jgi:hypothetical protein